MKKLLMCVIGTTMLTSVAVAEICTDFDENFNIVEYECGTSIKDAKKVESTSAKKDSGTSVKSESKTTKTITRERVRDVMDGNPLYLPKAGSSYSMTTLNYGKAKMLDYPFTEDLSIYKGSQEFGSGITDRFTFFGGVDASLVRVEFNGEETEKFTVAGLFAGGIYRLINDNSWKLDVLGKYYADRLYFKYSDAWDDENFNFDKRLTSYTWTLGVRGGYTSSRFTLAGHVMFDYTNDESFNWLDEPSSYYYYEDIYINNEFRHHNINVGLDGQLVLNRYINFVAGIEYRKGLDSQYNDDKYVEVENPDIWIGMLGLNLNVNDNTFVGLYAREYFNTPYVYRLNISAPYPGSEIYELKQSFEAGLKIGVSF